MKRICAAGAVLLLLLGTTAALADGGAMLLHEDAGPFTITLFAAPQPLRVGAADMSVMVQDRNSGAVLLDAAAELTASQQATIETIELTPGQATNRLLRAGSLNFSQPGDWKLALVVHRGHDVARLSTECTVAADRSRAGLLWFYLLLPVIVIILFLTQQMLKWRHAR